MGSRGLERGQRCELELASLAPSGDAVGLHASGLQIHLAHALPGERVRVRIEHVSRQAPRAFAKLEQVLAPSPHRRAAPCRHQGRCSGCPLMIADEPTQRRLKREMLRTELGLEVEPLLHAPDAELGYRWSSKRIVTGEPGRIVLGSYRRGSHRIADMAGCLVDDPAIAACADEIARVTSELGVVPCTAAPQPGSLRYAWLKTNGRGEVLVCLVLAEPDRALGEAIGSRLSRASGVFCSVQPSQGNALRGLDPELLAGQGSLAVELFGTELRVGPLGFLQPNPRVAALAYRDVLALPDGQPVGGAIALDLYAGAGATTRLLRQRFEQVLCCEADAESAAELGIPPETAERYLERLTRRQGMEGALSSFVGAEPRSIDLVVADPPRAGLGPTVCQLLAGLRPQRLHLMSCNPAALVRDLRELGGLEGGYDLRALRAYDTLPQTPHVELVAWLEARAR
jgi:23S rRNA (uracil1939-C5)-methyltransferase